MEDAKGYDTFAKIEPIEKGWSDDKKYYIETADGRRMLLRVSDISELERKKAEYGMMERVHALGVLTPEPIEFGVCNGGKSCYSLSGWLDGEDAKEVLPLLPEAEQYVLGVRAGETLRKIHTLPAPEDAEPWGDRFFRKVQGRIDFYNANPIKSENGDMIVRYLQKKRHLLNGRPQTFNHGDFNISNMMVIPDRQIGVIDFNAYNKDYGDPWWEFDPCMDGWGSEPSAYFHSGLIKGYFGGDPPGNFFEVFSYYLVYDALAALCDTSVHNQGEPEVGRRHMENILRWLDNMQSPVPAWYLVNLEWKDKYPRKQKPAYSELLDFFWPHIRELFLWFDREMRERFKVHNKYHRYIPSAGWAYGYGRSYGCELLSVTVSKDRFYVLGNAVKDEKSLRKALESAKKTYDGGFEERYAAVCAKRRTDQIERSKMRVAREKTEMEKLSENADPEKLNKFKWQKKVSQSDLLRLYQSESQGMIETDLLDDIGLTFYMRCKQAKEVRECIEKGQIVCHHCGAVLVGGRVSPSGSVLVKNADNYKPISCACGYSYTYREYRRNCNSVNMPGGRATPIFENFLQKWPGCRDTKSKMLLVDWLVHECHVTLMSGAKGRSVCVNLIEGSLKQISELILKLAYN